MVKNQNILFEVSHHIGNNRVRAISLSITDNIKKGDIVIDTGHVISVPVGKCTLGRILNVIGKPIDKLGNTKNL